MIWNDKYHKNLEDEAPAMFLPLVFAFHMLLVAVYMVVGEHTQRRCINRQLSSFN